MKKFIVIYHATNTAVKQMSEATPEQQKAGMAGWMAWAQKCGSQLIDMGAPLRDGQALSANGKHTNSVKGVNGYSILEAENMKEAIALLQGHPHLAYNAECSIEVHETMPLPGM